MDKGTIGQLMQTFSKPGELVWIGVRPARGEAMISVDEVMANQRSGLIGDRYNGSSGKRQVTLIQWEHLAVLASMTGKTISPEILRRNLVIKGINLLALKDHTFQIGDAILQTTGLCHPCSKMEQILGPGGYNAMRGHGGLTARVLKTGVMKIGDLLVVMPQADSN